MSTVKRRVAVNLPGKEYDELVAFAEKHDVSMAWLGRQAIIEFLHRYRDEHLQLPLRLQSGQLRAPQDDHAA